MSGIILQARSGKHILLAEDNAVSAYYVTRVLEQAGYQISHARDGEAVLSALLCPSDSACLPTMSGQNVAIAQAGGKDGFDLLVLDLRMPGVDGIAVARQLRQQPRTAALPIVVLTASLSTAERAILNELGITLLLLKPVAAKALVRCLDGALELPSGLSDLSDLPVRSEHAPPPAAPLPQATLARAQLSVFDYDAALVELSWNPDQAEQGQALLERLCEVFCADIPRHMDELRNAVALADLATAQRLGHALKNSAATLHAHRLRQAGANMEQSSRAALTVHLSDIEHELHVLLHTLGEHYQWPK